MPMIDADGCLINVSVEGRDGGPTLMLSNSLGCTLQMWTPFGKGAGKQWEKVVNKHKHIVRWRSD